MNFSKKGKCLTENKSKTTHNFEGFFTEKPASWKNQENDMGDITYNLNQ